MSGKAARAAKRRKNTPSFFATLDVVYGVHRYPTVTDDYEWTRGFKPPPRVLPDLLATGDALKSLGGEA